MNDFSKISTIDVDSAYSDWQSELADGVSDVAELCDLLEIECPDAPYQPKSFGLRVPRAFIQKMAKGDPHDPLLLQVLPDIKKLWQALAILPIPYKRMYKTQSRVCCTNTKTAY